MHEHDVELDATGRAPRERRSDDASEASAVGDAIAARRPDALGNAGLLHLQRAAGNAGVQALVGETDEESPVKHVVASPGEPLDRSTRHDMEARLGHDFSTVRVHSDQGAAASAVSVQAQAYTVGEHVVFAEGRYRPDSAEGRRTLAHELTHVVQQRQGPVEGTPAAGGIRVSHPSDRFEQEAERTAARATDGEAAAAPPSSPVTSVQRQGEGEQEEEQEPPVQRTPGTPSEQVEEPTDEDVPVARQVEPEEEQEEPPQA